MNKRSIGTQYEDMAVNYLINKGYTILERNYRVKVGEIDIIAKSPEGIVCYTEVKYRKDNRMGTPLEAVDRHKQHKISLVARWHYQAMHYRDNVICRFDVIGICGDGTIVHVENAFDLC